MYYFSKFKVLFLLFFFSLNTSLRGQDYYTKRVEVVKGSGVQFYFNSYTSIKNGLNYPEFTRLKISFDDIKGGIPDPFSPGWTLYCRASSSEILSDDGVSHLDLSYLVIKVNLSSFANQPSPIFESNFILSNSVTGNMIAKSQPGLRAYSGATAEILLDYSFAELPGTVNGLFDVKTGYYYVDLEFILVHNL